MQRLNECLRDSPPTLRKFSEISQRSGQRKEVLAMTTRFLKAISGDDVGALLCSLLCERRDGREWMAAVTQVASAPILRSLAAAHTAAPIQHKHALLAVAAPHFSYATLTAAGFQISRASFTRARAAVERDGPRAGQRAYQPPPPVSKLPLDPVTRTHPELTLFLREHSTESPTQTCSVNRHGDIVPVRILNTDMRSLHRIWAERAEEAQRPDLQCSYVVFVKRVHGHRCFRTNTPRRRGGRASVSSSQLVQLSSLPPTLSVQNTPSGASATAVSVAAAQIAAQGGHHQVHHMHPMHQTHQNHQPHQQHQTHQNHPAHQTHQNHQSPHPHQLHPPVHQQSVHQPQGHHPLVPAVLITPNHQG
jgi:hypothetical protein